MRKQGTSRVVPKMLARRACHRPGDVRRK